MVGHIPSDFPIIVTRARGLIVMEKHRHTSQNDDPKPWKGHPSSCEVYDRQTKSTELTLKICMYYIDFARRNFDFYVLMYSCNHNSISYCAFSVLLCLAGFQLPLLHKMPAGHAVNGRF